MSRKLPATLLQSDLFQICHLILYDSMDKSKYIVFPIYNKELSDNIIPNLVSVIRYPAPNP